MAVGKGSMARASKAADNTSVSKETKRTTAKTTAKTKAVTASKVISGTSKEVMQMIEYQKSDQVVDKRCSFLLLQNEFFYRTKNNIYRRNSYWIISDRTDKSEFKTK